MGRKIFVPIEMRAEESINAKSRLESRKFDLSSSLIMYGTYVPFPTNNLVRSAI